MSSEPDSSSVVLVGALTAYCILPLSFLTTIVGYWHILAPTDLQWLEGPQLIAVWTVMYAVSFYVYSIGWRSSKQE